MTHPVEVQHDAEGLVIEAIRQGDPEAMAELMRRHGRWVRGIIFGANGRLDEVDDVAQRVWMQVWRQARNLDDPSRWRVWLYRIARNAATDAARQRQRQRSFIGNLVERVWSRPTSARPADEQLAGEEQRRRMLEAIAALPDLYREPFVLRHLEDYSYQQIADVLGLPVDTVETRLVRARRLLRQRLSGKL